MNILKEDKTFSLNRKECQKSDHLLKNFSKKALIGIEKNKMNNKRQFFLNFIISYKTNDLWKKKSFKNSFFIN